MPDILEENDTRMTLTCLSCNEEIIFFESQIRNAVQFSWIQSTNGIVHRISNDLRLICSGCFVGCDSCGDCLEYFEMQDRICEDCETPQVETCQICGACDAPERMAYTRTHGWMCAPCEREQEGHRINSYSYKPAPKFHLAKAEKTKTFFGVELEIESGQSCVEDGAKIVKDHLGDLVYFKHDGSLNDGFEIVTHPFSFGWYTQNMKTNFLRELSGNGFKSWDAGTCGIHVHVSRDAFKDDAHVWKFCQLFLKNKGAWVKMAGRTSNRWASYDPERLPVADILKNKKHPERYCAVNLCNSETIEIRIFRGSLNETRFRSAIESVAGAVEYTRMIQLKDYARDAISFSHFSKFMELYSDEYPNAVEVMKKKGLI